MKKQQRTTQILTGLALLLCAAALVAGVRMTMAAYTANDYLKSVASTSVGQKLFASDLLAGYTTASTDDASIVERALEIDADSGQASFEFSVYNYAINDEMIFNPYDITYDLSITPSGLNSGETYSVSGQATASGQVASAGFTTTQTLAGNKAVKHTYTLTFPAAALGRDGVSFLIKATVTEGDASTPLLAAKVVPNKRATVVAANVEGGWVNGSDDVAGYDAYVYRVTVSGMDTQVRLTWGSGVALDPFFATNNAGATVDGASATFAMGVGSKDIVFYRASGSSEPASWSDIGVSVEKVG